MPQSKITLSEDSIDDILYYARAGETDSLLETLAQLKSELGVSEEDILLAAIDENTGNSALHMSAANGHTGKTPAQVLCVRN